MAMFSRRHYEFLAASINKMGGEDYREVVAKHLAEDLAADNERFDTAKFVQVSVHGKKGKQ